MNEDNFLSFVIGNRVRFVHLVDLPSCILFPFDRFNYKSVCSKVCKRCYTLREAIWLLIDYHEAHVPIASNENSRYLELRQELKHLLISVSNTITDLTSIRLNLLSIKKLISCLSNEIWDQERFDEIVLELAIIHVRPCEKKRCREGR